jgi:hypothetical protein
MLGFRSFTVVAAIGISLLVIPARGGVVFSSFVSGTTWPCCSGLDVAGHPVPLESSSSELRHLHLTSVQPLPKSTLLSGIPSPFPTKTHSRSA